MNKPQEHTTPNGNTWYRLESDVYGNPRIMAHYLNLVSPMQEHEARDMHPADMIANIGVLKQWAKKAVHGKTYHAKWFGGGIVWTSYLSDKQIDDMIDGIQADK